jgi:hypothetical protein
MPRPRRIPWKYCECGCHSFDVTVGGAYFSYFSNLRGHYYFSVGQHNPAIYGKRMKSIEAIEEEVRRVLKSNLAELKKWAGEK